MQLALRKTLVSNSSFLQNFYSKLIKIRLVSEYCHGGVVIDGDLYHTTASRGLHKLPKGSWSPENWEIFDTNTNDQTALNCFYKHVGTKYDWISLLAFIGIFARDSKRMYCFEWCWLALTNEHPRFKVTPEMLLAKIIHQNKK